MIEITDQKLFEKTVSDAMESAIMNGSTDGLAKRWTNAIARAALEIVENPYLDYDAEKKSLLICSSTSNNIYAANGVCQCKAFVEYAQPCWHRAAARLVRLYFEALDAPTPAPVAKAAFATAAEMSAAPYLKQSTGAKPERVGNIRI